MPQLQVISTPSQRLAYTNCVFVHPGVLPNADLVLVNDEHLFRVRELAEVASTAVAMNALQRRFAALSDQQLCSVERFEAPSAHFNLTSLSVEINSLVKFTGSIDCEAFVKEMRSGPLAGMPFSPQQIYVVDYHGTHFTLTCSAISTTTASAVVDKDAPPAPKPKYGVVTPDTEIVLSKASKAAFKLENQKAGGSASAIFKADFDFAALGIGGLDQQFSKIFRRAFASRMYPPSLIRELGLTPCRGMMLHGPPGTGKTLMARKIGKILNCSSVTVVKGPQLLSKFVGEAERAVRELFEPAEQEQAEKGDASGLHLIIFDEFDALVKERGSSRDGTGVHDNVVNQLLSKIDGYDALDNILVIGMTNRLDMIDKAILRPGRLELVIEIGLPDEAGRREIFEIHTAGHRKHGRLAADVSLDELAALAKNYTGSEICNVVQAATSFELDRPLDHRNVANSAANIAAAIPTLKVTRAHFLRALEEVRPAFGGTDERALDTVVEHGIVDYGPGWRPVKERLVDDLVAQSRMQMRSGRKAVLLTGPRGTGKSALAVHIGRETEYPFLRFLSAERLIGYSESQKVNTLRTAFLDAYKSTQSVIILDELELLVEYAHVGPRFSNPIMQALRVLVTQPPPKGHRLLILATSSSPEMLTDLRIEDVFDVSYQVPTIRDPEATAAIVKSLGIQFDTQEAEQLLRRTTTTLGMPIKRLIQAIDTAAAITARLNGIVEEGRKPDTVSVEGLSRALEMAGLSGDAF